MTHAAFAACVVVAAELAFRADERVAREDEQFLELLVPGPQRRRRVEGGAARLSVQGASPANDASLPWFSNGLMSTPATRAEAVLGPMLGTLRSER